MQLWWLFWARFIVADWTDEQKNKIADMWNSGETFSDIAPQFDTSRSAIAGLINRMRAAGVSFDRTSKPPSMAPSADRPPVRRGRKPRYRSPELVAYLEAEKERLAARPAKIRMDHVQHRPIEVLADKIGMPGIDKHLVPLCLYKGTRSFGRIHRWWNFTLAAMEQGCDDLTDIVKLSHHPAYSHLCGTETKVNRLSAQGFFTRLRDNPEVTNNVPHLTEWAEHVLPHRFHFDRVPLESFAKNCAPWRVFRIRRKTFQKGGGNIKAQPASACYPFIAHDPKKEGFDLVAKVNKAVPKGLPEEIRADICQDIICAILMGEMKEDDLQGGVKHFIAQGRKMFVNKWDFVGLDAPINGFEGQTYADVISGPLSDEYELDAAY